MDIIAHRGASAHAPENTMAAFRLAWESGADGIELDVWLSRDDEIVVHHDSTTRRCAGVNLAIADTDSATLRSLDVGRWKGEVFAGEAMPLLAEVLQEGPPGSWVLVEIKCGPEIIPVLQVTLAQIATRLRIVLLAMRLETLAACRIALPHIPCSLVIPWVEPTAGQRTDLPHWSALIEIAKNYGLAGLDPDYRSINREFAAAVRAAGLQLFTWTVNSVIDAHRLALLGLHAITTDYPAELRLGLSGKILALPDVQGHIHKP
jgi:glycerophosphoryl diester phosphodiesterase